MTGLSLPAVFQLRASAGSVDANRDTTVIFVYMGGGPSQFETYDPKPDAPSEYRGKYNRDCDQRGPACRSPSCCPDRPGSWIR